MPSQPPRELVLKKLRDCFANPKAAADALAAVDLYGTQPWHAERERVQLALLKGSQGDLSRLWQLLELADRDFRDALAGAEYPEETQTLSKAPPQELVAIRQRDRDPYEAWLRSDHP